MVLPIPYRSQLDEDAGYGKGDCGPATFAQILLALLIYISIDALGLILQKPRNYTITSLKELIGLAKTHFRVTLELKSRFTFDQVKALIDQRRAIICLVWYPYLPIRYDANYSNGHYVTIIGYEGDSIVYHDPYFRNGAGAALRATWDDFSRAWSKTGTHADTPRYGLIAPPLPTPKVELDKETLGAIRWYGEEATRAIETGNYERARDLLRNDVTPRMLSLEGVAPAEQAA